MNLATAKLNLFVTIYVALSEDAATTSRNVCFRFVADIQHLDLLLSCVFMMGPC